MDQKILFQEKLILNHYDHQSHLSFRFHVPQESQQIKINFSFDEFWIEEPVAIRRSLDKEGLYQIDEAEVDRIRNIITLSVNDNLGFRGAHHYFNTKQEIILADQGSTPGFLNRPVQAGMWEVTISCHGLFSDQVEISLEVMALGQFSQPQMTCPFSNQPEVNPKQVLRDRDLGLDLKDYKMELHSHTNHSDANQTLEELIQASQTRHLDWLAITDHNTISTIYAYEDWLEKPEKPQVLSGIEYTTFYGHFLVYGPKQTITKDWTRISLDNIDQHLQDFYQAGAMISLAHPFDVGNPFCTGCRFDYRLATYDHVHNIEVWNGDSPHINDKNHQAYQHWLGLLDQGLEINASIGRDWHQFDPNEALATTHVLAPQDASQEDILESLKLGRTYGSMGPELNLKINQVYRIGDRLPKEDKQWKLEIELKDLEADHQQICLYTDQGLLATYPLTGSSHYQMEETIDMTSYRLLRLEILDQAGNIVLFTNPIYQAQ